MSVLVISQNATFLQMTVRFLERQGVTVVGAAFRPDDALALAALRPPQVVVLGLSGEIRQTLALIVPLRAIIPQVIVIATVQLASDEHRAAAQIAGADWLIDTDTMHRELIPLIWQLTRSGEAHLHV